MFSVIQLNIQCRERERERHFSVQRLVHECDYVIVFSSVLFSLQQYSTMDGREGGKKFQLILCKIETDKTSIDNEMFVINVQYDNCNKL